MPILISHVFSWKTKFRNTDVDITFLFPRCKIVTNKTSKVFIGNVLSNQSNIYVGASYKKNNIAENNFRKKVHL